jgi:superfamily I DNA/RNA helicase
VLFRSDSPVLPGLDRFHHTVTRYGLDTALNPQIQVGTIHSVKGSEADNVVLLDSLTHRINSAISASEAAHDAECRVAYVGVTRARRSLYIMSERRSVPRFNF